MKKIILTAIISISCLGCMPTTEVQSVDDRPQLAIKNAPPAAVLFVDGMRIGPASEYDGKPKVLLLEAGTHKVMIESLTGELLYNREIFVDSELKTIVLNKN